MGQQDSGPGKNAGDSAFLKKLVLLAPLGGFCCFVLLYVLAARAYPGGSHSMPQLEGFSFWHNYLCDLLDDEAINGTVNSARFFARWALGVLCASLLLLWHQLPALFNRKSLNRSLMWLSGILALGTMVFLGDTNHDLIVRIAGVFGTIALLSCVIELHKAGHGNLVILALWSLLVFLLNYYSYETGRFRRALPVIQKLTFALFLWWFVLLNLALYKKFRLENR